MTTSQFFDLTPTREGFARVKGALEEAIRRHEDDMEMVDKLLDGKAAGGYGMEEYEDVITAGLELFLMDRKEAVQELKKGVADIVAFLEHGTLPQAKVLTTPCACGCGTPVEPGTRGQKRKYVDATHRSWAKRRRDRKPRED